MYISQWRRHTYIHTYPTATGTFHVWQGLRAWPYQPSWQYSSRTLQFIRSDRADSYPALNSRLNQDARRKNTRYSQTSSKRRSLLKKGSKRDEKSKQDQDQDQEQDMKIQQIEMFDYLLYLSCWQRTYLLHIPSVQGSVCSVTYPSPRPYRMGTVRIDLKFLTSLTYLFLSDSIQSVRCSIFDKYG